VDNWITSGQVVLSASLSLSGCLSIFHLHSDCISALINYAKTEANPHVGAVVPPQKNATPHTNPEIYLGLLPAFVPRK